MKALTVQEMIKKLETFPPNAILVVLREGNDHSTAVSEGDVKIVKSPYFGGDEPSNNKYDEDTETYEHPFVQIGVCYY